MAIRDTPVLTLAGMTMSRAMYGRSICTSSWWLSFLHHLSAVYSTEILSYNAQWCYNCCLDVFMASFSSLFPLLFFTVYCVFISCFAHPLVLAVSRLCAWRSIFSNHSPVCQPLARPLPAQIPHGRTKKECELCQLFSGVCVSPFHYMMCSEQRKMS
jgi:hypothetical protein